MTDCFDPQRQIGQFVEHQTRGIKAGNRDGGRGRGAGFESWFCVSLYYTVDKQIEIVQCMR